MKKMKKNVLLVWIAVTMMILSTGCGNQEEKVKNAAPMRVQSEVVHPSSDVHTKSYVGVVEEELADLMEVIRAVVKARGFSLEELEAIRSQKAAQRGGFEHKIFLMDVKTGEE